MEIVEVFSEKLAEWYSIFWPWIHYYWLRYVGWSVYSWHFFPPKNKPTLRNNNNNCNYCICWSSWTFRLRNRFTIGKHQHSVLVKSQLLDMASEGAQLYIFSLHFLNLSHASFWFFPPSLIFISALFPTLIFRFERVHFFC